MINPLTEAVDATILNAAKRAAKRQDEATLVALLQRATYAKTKLAIKKMLAALR